MFCYVSDLNTIGDVHREASIDSLTELRPEDGEKPDRRSLCCMRCRSRTSAFCSGDQLWRLKRAASLSRALICTCSSELRLFRRILFSSAVRARLNACSSGRSSFFRKRRILACSAVLRVRSARSSAVSLARFSFCRNAFFLFSSTRLFERALSWTIGKEGLSSINKCSYSSCRLGSFLIKIRSSSCRRNSNDCWAKYSVWFFLQNCLKLYMNCSRSMHCMQTVLGLVDESAFRSISTQYRIRYRTLTSSASTLTVELIPILQLPCCAQRRHIIGN